MTESHDLSSINRHPHYALVAGLIEMLLSQHPEAQALDRRALIAECLGEMESMDRDGASIDTRVSTLGRLVGMRVGGAVQANAVALGVIEGAREPRYSRESLRAAAAILGLLPPRE